jgi:hypothetical protein
MRRTTLLHAAGAALLLAACAPGAGDAGAARGDSALPADSAVAAPRQPAAPAPEGASDAVPADSVDRSLPPPPRYADTAGGQGRGDLARLERELRALARVTGCDAASQCRSVAVGEKACGGPRAYLVYCPRSTDERALLAKAEELRRAERAWNQANQIVSTCEMLLEPRLELAGGQCRAASAAVEGPQS